MNKEYKIKLDLNKKLYNKKMAFNQFDKNVNDFYIEVTKNNEVVKDLDKSIITLVAIKPNNAVDAQFIEVKEGQIYADLKPSMCDLVGNYQAKAMIVLEGEIVTTDTINYSVSEDKIISRLNDDVVSDERFPLFTDALARLSTIEISEEQRVINEAERILSEENRKIEESKRVEAELVRQHEEADRTKYDATRESNENIRKINEEARISSENVRLENEANRIEQETNRVKAEQLRKDNYNFMTEDEERRRLEANAHKEAEVLRVQAETNRVNEEAKRRTTEQARVLAENTRVSNENTRKANEETRQNNETHRVEAETQRQSRYNSFIADAEANANNFENYTNTAKVKEEERKSNELNRKSQEDRRVSNEVERISNENTRKANEKAREKNETSRQNIFENKVSEVDEKIVELDTTKDNFISSINTKVDNKISEIDNAKDNFVASINTKVDTKISEIEVAKSDMTNTVSNKINEVETRFNALTSSQQQDAEVIDARDGETSLKARLDRDIKETTKELDKIKKLEESTVSTVTTESGFTTVEATSNGYFEDVKLEGKTLVNLIDKYMFLHGGYTLNENMFFTGVANGTYLAVNDDVAKYKPSSTYTMIVEVVSNTLDGEFKPNIPHTISIFNESFTIPLNATGVFVKKLTTKASFEGCTTGLRAYILDTCKSGSVKARIGVLEGDHTQNLHSYFEGLKSVGEDADKVVVSSVNKVNKVDLPFSEDISQNKSFTDNGNIVNSNDQNIVYYEVIGGTEYKIKNRSLRRVVFFKDSEFLSELILVNPTDIFTSPVKCNKIGFAYNKAENPVLCGANQADKKRLLYYNEETQSWEKPILRQWDSIEKHADGKYYYHQRSGEVVLNGSENWNNDKNSSTISPETYRQSIQFNAIDIPSASFNMKTSPNIISDLLPTVIFGDVYSYNHIGISISGTDSIGTHIIINNNFTDVTELKQWLQANNLTVVYELAQEKVYECTNIDLITYANETNYIVECGAISPKTTLKVHNNISNVVSLLQKKVSLLESNITSYMITQNRLMLASRYNADNVTFKVDYPSMMSEREVEIDYDLFKLIQDNIIVGPENYDVDKMLEIMDLYAMIGFITWEMWDYLYEVIYSQINPVIEDLEGTPEI